MSRIRTIKPEFWTSEQVGSVSHSARLLFVGIWNFADDRGIHADSVKRLKAEIFPFDPVSSAQVAEWLTELIEVGLVERYTTTHGEKMILVTGWKHQKINRPSYKFLLPGEVVLPQNPGIISSQNSVNAHGALTEDSLSTHRRNGREGSLSSESPENLNNGVGVVSRGGASPMPTETPPPTAPGLTSFRWDPAKKAAFQVDGGDFDSPPAAAGAPQDAQDGPPPPSPYREAAKALVARFLAAREEHWPGHPSFTSPTLTLIAQAENILESGLPADTAIEVVTRYMPKDAAKGQSPPNGFHQFRRSLENAIAAAGRARGVVETKVPKKRANGLRMGSPEWHAREKAMKGETASE